MGTVERGHVRSVFAGGLVVGTLDILGALVFFGLRGVKPILIFQSIAAGLLGRASFQGGIPTALLGGVCHFFIAFAIVLVYGVAGRRFAVFTKHPFVCGPAYGILVYLIMNFIVLPLSAAAAVRYSVPVVVNGLFAHVFFVGLPSALFARAGGGAGA